MKLAFGGCGTIWYSYIGVFQYIENKIEFDALSGTSGGAIATSLYSKYRSSEVLIDLATSNPLKNLKDINYFPLDGFGYLKGEALHRLLKKYLPGNMSTLKIPIKLYVTNVSKGILEVYDTYNTPDAKIADVVRASMSIPGMFNYHNIQGDLYADGGLLCNFPIETGYCGFKALGTHGDIQKINSSDSIPTKFSKYLGNIINAVINAQEKEHINNTLYSNTCMIPTGKNGTEFNFNNADIRDLITTGYINTMQWYKNLKAVR